jgi:sterol desaturase/sphingolipid hydroxylase (fatty acid hydroxylase superfamily)
MEVFVLYVFSLLLMINTSTSPWITFVSMCLLSYYSYFIHVLIHKIPKECNPHTLFHHSKNVNDFWVNLIIETMINVLFFVMFYCAKVLLNLKFIPNILIVYYGLIYVSVHVINYSIFHLGENHRSHHLDQTQKCNFGPDTFDHLLNSNCNSNYESLMHMLPNILGAFLISWYT